MGRSTSKNPEPKVKKTRRKGRPNWVLRWFDPSESRWVEEATEVPIGKTKREQERSLGAIERLILAKEEELLAAPPPDRAIDLHVEAYETHLEAAGRAPKYIFDALARIRRLVEDCGWRCMEDISAADFEAFISRVKLPSKRFPKGMSVGGVNGYIRSLKAFCRWSTIDRLNGRPRLASHPIQHIRPRSNEVDRRRRRRALSADDFAALLGATLAGPSRQGISPHGRVYIYTLAAWTGLRANELAQLRLRDIRLDAETPHILLPAPVSKHRKVDRIPLHPAVAELSKKWMATLPPALDVAWVPLLTRSGRYVRRTADMLRADLAAAGLAYQDAAGDFADFHSLRHRFVTQLLEHGVPMGPTSDLARHSGTQITIDLYAHLTLSANAKHLAAIPAPPPAKKLNSKDTPLRIAGASG